MGNAPSNRSQTRHRAALPGLRALLRPLEPDRFFDRYWQQQHYVAHAGKALVGRLADELEGFDFHRLLDRHTGLVQAWFGAADGAYRSATISTAAAHAAYESGVTLYLHRMCIPAVSEWQQRLARELGHSPAMVTCSIFAAKRGAGTRCHFDNLENFTVQLQGRKTWQLAPNSHVTFPLQNWITGTEVPEELALYAAARLPRDMPQSAAVVTLRPGDVLYVPRGHWHSADATQDSLSLFLGFAANPVVDVVLAAIRARLLQEAPWRRNFTDAGASRRWKNHSLRQVTELLRGLETTIAGLGPADIIASPARTGVTPRRGGSAARRRPA